MSWRRWSDPATAFVTGTAVTVFEFSAPNLFRAFFGQTIYVWANVIGVILASLALGYAIGGRWADRRDPGRVLALALALGGAYAMLVGLFGADLSGWIAGPEEYPQDASLPHFFVQSLAASLILFGPPLVALGIASPCLVKRAARYRSVGDAAGIVFGIGTVGSLTGIYLTTFLLLDTIGVRATITASASVMLLLAAGIWWRGGKKRPAVAALAALLLLPFGVRRPWEAWPESKLVLTIESPYQLIRVVDKSFEDPEDPKKGKVVQRWLAFDEGMQSYHSISKEPEDESKETANDDPWTGAYYDVFARLHEWVGRNPSRICILGNAAGTMSRLLHDFKATDESFQIDGIEIDPAVTRAARLTMGLTKEKHPHLTIHHADGRTFLAATPPETYDVIVLDAYARQVSIPPALVTAEFFRLCRDRLTKGGMLIVNLGALRPGGELAGTVADTVASAFEHGVYLCPLPTLNVLMVARRGSPPPPPPEDTPLDVAESFARHISRDRILTDDLCPVERLTANDLQGQ